MHYWVDRDLVRCKDGLRLVLPADGGFCSGAGLTDHEALMLEGEKAEELVFEEGAADGEAGVVVADLLLCVGEGAFRAEEFVAVEVVDSAVNSIGTGAKREVDECRRDCGPPLGRPESARRIGQRHRAGE